MMAGKTTESRSRNRRKSGQDSPAEVEVSSLTPKKDPELVFGLVGPIGVNLDPVIEVLKSQLSGLEYFPHVVRLSEQIESFFDTSHNSKPEAERIAALMDAGTKLRVEGNEGAAVAMLGLAAIRQLRDDHSGGM